ncbi:MAG: (d)CMP kinase [Alphaproteobacteria bacterium]|nr:(d)CMP kinase [Alphaproteobacteria bacterium]
MNKNIIAIDGPAGVGKGTLTRALAKHYDFAVLDTGSLYRAATFNLIEKGYDMENIDSAIALEETKKISDNHKILEYAKRDEIRLPLTTKYVYVVADNPPLREVLKVYQTEFGLNPPGGKRGAIIEGRDIGTVIFPGAPVKIFLTASSEVRARRRFYEYEAAGKPANYDEILAEMVKRDARDTHRAVGGLIAADDAVIIDTSEMSIERVIETACKLIDSRLKL